MTAKVKSRATVMPDGAQQAIARWLRDPAASILLPGGKTELRAFRDGGVLFIADPGDDEYARQGTPMTHVITLTAASVAGLRSWLEAPGDPLVLPRVTFTLMGQGAILAETLPWQPGAS